MFVFYPICYTTWEKLRSMDIFGFSYRLSYLGAGKPGDLFEPTGEGAVTWGTTVGGRCWWQRELPCNIYKMFFS